MTLQKLAICITFNLGALSAGYAMGALLIKNWDNGGWLLLVAAIALYVSRSYLRGNFWK